MNSEKSCADYFRSRPEYRRCFEALWKKWRSYGRTAGKIVLDDVSEEECRAIGGITGKRYLDDRIVFSFSEFEQGLQKTRFAPVDIKKLLEIYFGKTLVSRGEQEKRVPLRRFGCRSWSKKKTMDIPFYAGNTKKIRSRHVFWQSMSEQRWDRSMRGRR